MANPQNEPEKKVHGPEEVIESLLGAQAGNPPILNSDGEVVQLPAAEATEEAAPEKAAGE